MKSLLFWTAASMSLTAIAGQTATPTTVPTASPSVSQLPTVSPTQSPTNEAFTVSRVAQLLTADEVCQILAGDGVTITSGDFSAGFCFDNVAEFNGGTATIGIDTGVVIGTSNATRLDFDDPTTCSNPAGTSLFSDIIPISARTFNAAVLTCSFTCDDPIANAASVGPFVFGSQEFAEIPVGATNYRRNDLAGIFLNGVNVAVVDGNVVSVNSYAPFGPLKDDLVTHDPAIAPFLPAFSMPEGSFPAPIMQEVNTLQMAVTNVNSQTFDSYLFLGEQSIECIYVPPAPTSTPTAGPTKLVTDEPTSAPTETPVTSPPTAMPTMTLEPTTTLQPTETTPSAAPTSAPTITPVPTPMPSAAPTSAPSSFPSSMPSGMPSSAPNNLIETSEPTVSEAPSAGPTTSPTLSPAPTTSPTPGPTQCGVKKDACDPKASLCCPGLKCLGKKKEPTTCTKCGKNGIKCASDGDCCKPLKKFKCFKKKCTKCSKKNKKCKKKDECCSNKCDKKSGKCK